MKRIAIFQSDLRVGGIQKALVNILNLIDYSRCEVDLYLFDNACFFEYQQRENLHLHFEKPYPFLNRLVYFGLMKRFARRVRTDREYDVAVDFNSYRNECAVNALTVPARKRVMWIHNDVEIKKRNELKYRVLWHFFRGKLREYDEFAAVSPGIIEGFRRSTGILDKPVTAIPNRIDTAEIFEKSRVPIDFKVDPACYNLCTMGRICHQKGFDILMDIFAEVRKTRPDMHLYLLGDGPDRGKLEKQIASLGLSNAVTLLGNQANPFPYLNQMDGFALTSRYEGQGIVLWEARTLGLELFMAKHLERYNPGLVGTEDLVSALRGARRREKHPDDLREYNEAIARSLGKVLELDGSGV
jgi:glycosyltransferase involved in cell wall biosynthesis